MGSSRTTAGTLLTVTGNPEPTVGASLTQVGESLTQAGRLLTHAGRLLTQAGRSLTQAGRSLTQTGTLLTQAGKSLTQARSLCFESGRGRQEDGVLAGPLLVNIRNGATKLMGNLIDGTTTSLPSGNFQLVSLVTTDSVSADQICQDRVYHGSWQGDIAEILIYNRALTMGEEAKVGNYLSNKYGLVTSYSSLIPPVSSISVVSLVPDLVGISCMTLAARSNQGRSIM